MVGWKKTIGEVCFYWQFSLLENITTTKKKNKLRENDANDLINNFQSQSLYNTSQPLFVFE